MSLIFILGITSRSQIITDGRSTCIDISDATLNYPIYSYERCPIHVRSRPPDVQENADTVSSVSTHVDLGGMHYAYRTGRRLIEIRTEATTGFTSARKISIFSTVRQANPSQSVCTPRSIQEMKV